MLIIPQALKKRYKHRSRENHNKGAQSNGYHWVLQGESAVSLSSKAGLNYARDKSFFFVLMNSQKG